MATFLVTGGAGFIGSNLVRALLDKGEAVRVIDDFSTGRRENLADLGSEIVLVEGDICDEGALGESMAGVDYCLHQAAIPSVPRSVRDPRGSNRALVDGSLSVFLAARDAGVKRVVYASSSSVYGNAAALPLEEGLPRAPISPYGVGKATIEMYADVFSELYGIDLVGLRYFNVFGPHQDPESQYAAVVPIFITHLMAGEAPPVFGDGEQARDFSYIENVVQANLRACIPAQPLAGVYNIACGGAVSVLELATHLEGIMGTRIGPAFKPPRAGDIRNSWADISRAQEAFGYDPAVGVREGLERTVAWFRDGKEDA